MNVSAWLDKHAGWIIAGAVALTGLIGVAMQRGYAWLSAYITARHNRTTDHDLLENLNSRVTELEQFDHEILEELKRRVIDLEKTDNEIKVTLAQISSDLKWIKHHLEDRKA